MTVVSSNATDLAAIEDAPYSFREQILSSCSGALITSVFVTPFDVVKIRLQAQEKNFPIRQCFLYHNGLWDHLCFCRKNGSINKFAWYKRPGHFNGTVDAFVKIAKNEGIGSLWSGLPHTLVMAVPATVLYFTMYEQIRDNTYKLLKPESSKFWVPMLAGMFSRTLTVTTVSPLEFIRTKAQSENMKYSEMCQKVLNLVRNKGILSLWTGLVPTLLRDVPFSAIYWSTYELLKRRFSNGFEPTLLQTFLAGALAGSLSATITAPFDVVKTHRQIELGEADILQKSSRIGTFQVIVDLYKKRGTSALFAGLTPRLIRIAPSCAIMITSYEFSKMYFKNRKLRKEFEEKL